MRQPRGPSSLAPLLHGAAQGASSAEQPVTVEPISETAPLSLAETTPPFCSCEERARVRRPWPSLSQLAAARR